MTLEASHLLDIQTILAHRYDNGADLWTTKDKKLLKGSPFTTLDSALYLLELGLPAEDALLKEIAALIFSTQRGDGGFKVAPSGGLYPCQTALALKVLCYMHYAQDQRVQQTLAYFLKTQEVAGGWKCHKYSFGRGPETECATPLTTLIVLDAMRFSDHATDPQLNQAVEFLLEHWRIKEPISPCHYGIGKLFKEVEYPFRGYNLFYYLYVLSFYPQVKRDQRYLEALELFESKLMDDQVVVERVVPKLGALTLCKKRAPSELATRRYHEIIKNLSE